MIIHFHHELQSYKHLKSKTTHKLDYVIFKYLYSIYYDMLYLWEVVLSSSLS